MVTKLNYIGNTLIIGVYIIFDWVVMMVVGIAPYRQLCGILEPEGHEGTLCGTLPQDTAWTWMHLNHNSLGKVYRWKVKCCPCKYVATIYDMVIIWLRFLIWFQLWWWLCNLKTISPHYIIWLLSDSIFWWDFNHDSYYVIQRLFCCIIWYGYHLALFFNVNSTVMLVW